VHYVKVAACACIKFKKQSCLKLITINNYKVDQFVNIVKSYESTQPTINSIIKSAAKIAEELSQPNEKSDAKHEGIQHTKARLGEF
jgi:hypothetical protein